MDKLELRLDPDQEGPTEDITKSHPIAGYFAVIFGLLGIFVNGLIFVPLSLICSVIALVSGQFIWAVLGILVSLAGVLTSPVILMMVGFGWMAKMMSTMLGMPMP